MKRRTLALCAFSFFCGKAAVKPSNFDLTVVSSIDFNGSVRRHAIGLIECLKDKLAINFIPSRECFFGDINPEVTKIILDQDKQPGNVAILEDPVWFASAMPNSFIKLAFSVFESTKLPKNMVAVINETFDAVVVADPFYLDVYKSSGVNVPLFHIPLGIYIDEFLEARLKKKPNKPFVFGCGSRFFRRKNFELLIRSFVKEFGNNRDVVLKINGGGKYGSVEYFNKLKRLVKQLKVSNVHITNDALSWDEYVSFILSMDCIVQISRGEGFSIIPREAMAAGIPAIVSDNTAQKTICASGLVYAVSSRVPHLVHCQSQRCGYQYDCSMTDVQKALRDVYHQYDHYLSLMPKAREWAKNYQWSRLRKRYMSLIKPTKILYGDRDEVTDTYFKTKSKRFYEKLKMLQSMTKENV